MIARGAAGAVVGLALLVADPAGAATWTVEVFADGFSPAALTVDPGDAVTWVNRSPVPHEMAFTGNPTRGPEPKPRWFLDRSSVTVVMTRPGRYPYRCNWHGIYGVVTVRPGPP